MIDVEDPLSHSSSAFTLEGEFTSAQGRSYTYNWYGLAISLAYRSGKKAGIVLVQMISTCLRGAYRWGGGSQHPVLDTETARQLDSPR